MLQRSHHTKQQHEVHEQGHVRDHSRPHVVHGHEDHHEDQSVYRRLETGQTVVPAQARADAVHADRVFLQSSVQRTGIERADKIVDLFLCKPAGDDPPVTDDRLDRRGADRLPVQDNTERLAHIVPR